MKGNLRAIATYERMNKRIGIIIKMDLKEFFGSFSYYSTNISISNSILG